MCKKEKYNKNGFLIEKNMISSHKIESLLNQINQLLESQLRALNVEVADTVSKNFQILFNKDIERYKKVVSALWRSLDITKFMLNDSVSNFIKDIFGFDNIFLPGGQVLHIQSKSLMVPDGYFGFDPHQDYRSVQGSLDGLIVWIPLVDIDKDNYPLEVIPGSHLNGLYPLISSDEPTSTIEPTSYVEEDFESIFVKKGDVIFISYFTIHRSGREGLKENVRIAVSNRFDNGNEKSFMERGYPTAYQRIVNRELFDDSFPTKKDLRKQFS